MGAPATVEFLSRLSRLVDARERCIVATVVATQGSASARPGAKTILNDRGDRVFGWIGGGCAETAVRDEGLAALEEGLPRLVRLDLDDEVLGVGMPCGGHMDVYIEPVIPDSRLVVLGHGAIAETAAAIGKLLELHVTVNDPLATAAAFPTADVRIEDDPEYAKVECDADTYVLITTQHKSDYEALTQVLGKGPAWVGLVASPKRSALVLERLFEDGFSPEQLSRVAAPCGLDIGSRTPQEIALSILSEVLMCRRGGGTGRPLVEVKGARVREDGVRVPDEPASGEKCPT